MTVVVAALMAVALKAAGSCHCWAKDRGALGEAAFALDAGSAELWLIQARSALAAVVARQRGD